MYNHSFYEVKTFEVYESQGRTKAFTYRKQLSDDVAMKTDANVCQEVKHCLVTIAKRPHLFPCRTQKLSSLAPMVVGLTFRESRTLPGDIVNWRISSAGRASALQAEGRRFEPVILHHFNLIAGLAQLVEQLTCNQ